MPRLTLSRLGWLLAALALVTLTAPRRSPRWRLDLRLPGLTRLTLEYNPPRAHGDLLQANLELPAHGQLLITTQFPGDEAEDAAPM
jgi:hypothetical protein